MLHNKLDSFLKCKINIEFLTNIIPKEDIPVFAQVRAKTRMNLTVDDLKEAHNRPRCAWKLQI